MTDRLCNDVSELVVPLSHDEAEASTFVGDDVKRAHFDVGATSVRLVHSGVFRISVRRGRGVEGYGRGAGPFLRKRNIFVPEMITLGAF